MNIKKSLMAEFLAYLKSRQKCAENVHIYINNLSGNQSLFSEIDLRIENENLKLEKELLEKQLLESKRQIKQIEEQLRIIMKETKN